MSDLRPNLTFKQNVCRILLSKWRRLAASIHHGEVTDFKGILHTSRQAEELYSWFQAMETSTASVEYMEMRFALHSAYRELIEVVNDFREGDHSIESLVLAQQLQGNLKDKLEVLANVEPDFNLLTFIRKDTKYVG